VCYSLWYNAPTMLPATGHRPVLLSAVSFLVVAQSSSEIPEGLMNNTVYLLLLLAHDVGSIWCCYRDDSTGRFCWMCYLKA